MSFGLDDHRDGHQDESDRRFAREIVGHIVQLIAAHPSRRVVMVAPPRLLGLMRDSTGILAGHDLELHELARDLTRETTAQLHDHLAELERLPRRRRLGVAS